MPTDTRARQQPFNLARGEFGPVYVGLTATEAVIAAHAQEQGDYNTWDYWRRYGHLVVSSPRAVTCGDWSVLKEA